MSGIAGILGIPPDRAVPALARMRDALAHRGPAARETVFLPCAAGEAPPVGLVQTHRRIRPVSHLGARPKRDERGACLTFDGALHDRANVTRELREEGHPCDEATDAETILHAYAAWGPASIARLRGMFAWAVAAPAEGTVWLCRDRLGIKPLYLTRPASGGLLFASEVRALVAAGPELVPPRVSAGAIESFLAQGMVCGDTSIVDGIRALPPGTSLVLRWDGREISQDRYWHPPFEKGPAVWLPRAEAVATLGKALREAVGGHLGSEDFTANDATLGLLLSGGMASSVIATIATEARSVRTFTLGLDDPAFDRSPVGARVARHLGTDQRTLHLGHGEILRDLGEVFRAMDQPTVGGFAPYFLFRAARRAGLTNALGGIGGDALFGHTVTRAAALASWARQLGRRSPAGADSGSTLASYLQRRELFPADERRSLHALPLTSDANSGLPTSEWTDLASGATNGDTANSISAFELSHYVRSMLLRDADVFGMAAGLEVGVPFLDHPLVEVVVPFPGRWKRNERGVRRAKRLLAEAVGPRLPSGIARRRKRGSAFPWRAWLVGPLRARAHAALSKREVWRSIGLAEEIPNEMWDRFLEDDARVGAAQITALWVLAEYAQSLSPLPPLTRVARA